MLLLRIERRAAHQAIQAREDGRQLFHQAFAARRRLVPGGRADQQIVVKHVAQSLHGPTERRLAEEEPGRGARDAALFRYRAEDDQQVQVDLT